jgi:hypothetical protein
MVKYSLVGNIRSVFVGRCRIVQRNPLLSPGSHPHFNSWEGFMIELLIGTLVTLAVGRYIFKGYSPPGYCSAAACCCWRSPP